MPLKIVEETVEKDVTFLGDVDVRFVSLVRHGANQMPFRIIKSEKGGEKNMPMVVQSILLPKGKTLEDLSSKSSLEWLAEAKSEDVQEFEEYSKLVQLKVEKFVPETLNLVKLDDSGAFALVGALVEKGKSSNTLTLGSREVSKLNEIQPAPMDTIIAEEPRPAFVLTFRDMFEKELGSFLDVVRGALSQSQSEPMKRKKLVMEALKAFGSFMSIGMDTLGKESAKMDVEKQTTEEGNMELFKSKEEFVEAVGEVLKETVPGMIAASIKALKDEAPPKVEPAATATETPPAETVAKAEADANANAELVELTKTVTTLAASVQDLSTKWESQLAVDPAAITTDPPNGSAGPVEKKSVFAGLLTHTPQ